MTYSSEVLADIPELYLRMNDATATCADSSGNSRNGTHASTNLGFTGLLVGDSDKSVDFNGSSSRAFFTDASWMDVTTCTIEALINPDTISGTDTIVGRDVSGTGAARCWLFRLNAGKLEFIFFDSGGTQRGPYTAATTLSTGVSYYVAVTFDGSNVNIFLGNITTPGSLVNDLTTAISASMRNVATDINVGVRRSTVSASVDLFDGRIDEVAFYSSALSSTRLAAHYAAATGTLSGTSAVAPSVAIATTGFLTISGTSAVAAAAAIATVGILSVTGTSAVAPSVSIATTGVLTVTGTSAVSPSVAIATTGALGVPATSAVDTTADIVTTGRATGTSAVALSVAVATTGGPLGTSAISPAASIVTTGAGSGTVARTVTVTIATTGGILFTGTSAVSPAVDIATTGVLTEPPAETDTNNRAGGRVRSGLGITAFDPPLEPVPAAMVLGASYPIAQAFGSTTMVGNQAHFAVATARGTQTRLQILYGNRDVTYLFGVPTPRPDFQRATPFDFGPSTLRFPQFANPQETVGQGRWSFLRLGKPVRYRVIDVATGDVLKTLYRGVHTGYDPDSGTLALQVGGQATGRMALRDQQAPLFSSRTDVLNLMRRVFQSINLPFDDDRAPTGIELGRFGDTGMLDYAQQVLARTWSRGGSQFTVMPGDDGKYSLFRRDTETIHGTIYLDDARVSGSLHRDMSEEPNRIFGRGTTSKGRRIHNGVYPGLVKIDPVPPYPMNDGSSFGLGTLSSETDHGFLAMLARLQTLGLLSRNDADETDGEYTQDVMDAMSEVQDEAGILGIEGNMTEESWDALFNVGSVGYSVWWSKIEPMASLRPTRRYKRTPDGAILGPNPTYDKHLLEVHRTLDFGAGFEVRQMHEFSRAELDAASDPNWAGTITLGLGAIVRGDHTPGVAITSDDAMADWELDPGQNYKVVNSAGGELVVHCSGITYGESPVQLTVDTRFRDAQPVWEVIRRNKESRGDLNRKANQQRRASTEVKDVLTETEEYGGRIDPVPVDSQTWTHFPVVMGEAGQINETRIRTRGAVGDAESDVAVPTRFVLCVSGIEIPRSFLTANVPHPLTDKSPWFDEDFQQRLRDEFRMWYIIGEPGALGGYSPRVQTMDGATITGKWHDKSPWPFETGEQPIGHVSMFAEDATIVAGGRILWNQEIVGS